MTSVLKVDSIQNAAGKPIVNSTGSVLQVKSAVKVDAQGTNSATAVDITGLSVNITPSSSSNKILVMTNVCYGGALNLYGAFFVKRDSANMVVGTYGTNNNTNATFAVGENNSNSNFKVHSASHTYLDSPSTTSQITYKVQFSTMANNSYFYINRPDYVDNTATWIISGTSTITVMEIAG